MTYPNKIYIIFTLNSLTSLNILNWSLLNNLSRYNLGCCCRLLVCHWLVLDWSTNSCLSVLVNNWLSHCNLLWYRGWYSKGLLSNSWTSLLNSDSLLNRLDVLWLNVCLLCSNWYSLYNRSCCLKCLCCNNWLLLNLLNCILL
jgi:hypothetical protein